MPYVITDKPNCPNCNKSGLAILPVRYAVVPMIAGATLPASLGNKVTSVVLKHHKYALRTLRKGYLYLYYEKHARGRHIKWEVYSVAEGGTLWKQLSIGAIQEITEIQCSRKAHLIPASVITIDTPEKCGRVWMAFSEHPWSEETFKDFAQDEKLRDRRMQTFAPAVWIKSRGYRHGLEATEANLNEVVEYKTGFVLSTLGGTGVKDISAPDGSFKKEVLHHCSTVHPVTVRRDDKATLADMMKKAGERSDKPPHAPIIISLWDSVGIAHELNGFRNDAMGWIKKYNIEREFQADAATAIEGAKIALAKHAATVSRANFSAGAFKWDTDATRSRMQLFDMSHGKDPAARRRELDLCERWERDAANRVPTHIARQRVQFTGLAETEWLAQMADIDVAAGPVAAPVSMISRDALYERDPWAARARKEASVRSWEAYEPRIDRAALNKFLEQRKTFVIAASVLADARSEDVVKWISSNELTDALLEFHDNSLADGEAFTTIAGTLIFGIESSPAGRQLIRGWVNSEKVTATNLLWRSFSLNQKEGNADMDKILEAIAANKETPLSERALEKIKDATKHLAKIGQLTQKGLSLHNALRKPGAHVVPTGGIEKILISVGNLFLQPFIRKGIDTLSEGIIIGLLFARAGSHHLKIMNLLLETAKSGTAGRAEIMMAFTMGRAIVSNRFNAQKAAWEVLAKDADIPKANTVVPHQSGGFNESKELKFGMIATILQGIYVLKLYSEAGDQPDNERLQTELWAAGLSLGAGLADLGAIGIKTISGAKDAAMSFQALKLSGGILSAGSAWIICQSDFESFQKQGEKGNDGVAYLYAAKGLLGAAGGVCSLFTSITYAEPAFRLIARKFPMTILGRMPALSQLGTRMLGQIFFARAALMMCGIYFSLAIIVVQLLIWKYSDDELQDWCDRCAFGREWTHRYGSSKIQMDEFNNLTKGD